MQMGWSKLPKDVVDIILSYDGRIKYHRKRKEYANTIHKYDERYKIVEKVLFKKSLILKSIQIQGRYFYFEFGFDFDRNIGLCYDYGFNSRESLEICYYDTRGDSWKQERTYF